MPFIAAILTGDITAYDAALDRWERRLVELNLWITIEKARELCIRGLFRRVYVFHASFVTFVFPSVFALLTLGSQMED